MLRDKPQQTPRGADASIGAQDVAGARGPKGHRPPLSNAGAQQLVQPQDAGLLTESDIAALVSVEWDRQRLHIGPRHIRDVDEVTGLFASSLNHDGLVGEQTIQKHGDDTRIGTRWVLARPKDVEVA